MEAVQKQKGKTVNSGLPHFAQTVAPSTLLAISCLISYSIVTNIVSREYFVSRDNQLLGGVWAAIATIFVFHQSYDQSARAALTRTLASKLSFILCQAYLLVFPLHVLGVAIAIAIISIILAFGRRIVDIMTAGITTVVMFVVAGVSAGHPWIQSIFWLADTAVGIFVGQVASWISFTLGLSSASRNDAS